MTYGILFSDTALRQMKKIEKQHQGRIISALERIRINPERHVKKLVGGRGFRLRVGNYRVIMDIYQDKLIILVIKVGQRKNIYQ